MKQMHWFDDIRQKTAKSVLTAHLNNLYLNCSVNSFDISRLVACAESNDNRIVVFNLKNTFLGQNWQKQIFDDS